MVFKALLTDLFMVVRNDPNDLVKDGEDVILVILTVSVASGLLKPLLGIGMVRVLALTLLAVVVVVVAMEFLPPLPRFALTLV